MANAQAFQGQRVFITEPREALLQFAGEQSPVKADTLQDSFTKLKHGFNSGLVKDATVEDENSHVVLQQTQKLPRNGLHYLCGGMKRLHNIEDRRVLLERMKADTRPRTTLSFYRYVHLEDPNRTRNELYEAWEGLEVLGRTYVAREGINAQISLLSERFEEFKAHIESLGWLPDLRLNVAVEQGKSFFKLIVRVRERIVADGLQDGTFDVTDCGNHLKAEEFNELTDREDTVLIDMRNSYESEVGHFEGAFCPDVNTFREEIDMVEEMFQDQKDTNIVMYCTGGIRVKRPALTSSTKASRTSTNSKAASSNTRVRPRKRDCATSSSARTLCLTSECRSGFQKTSSPIVIHAGSPATRM